MKKFISKSLFGVAVLFGLSMCLTSCEDILGHWEKPTPVVPGGVTPTPIPEEVYAFSLQDMSEEAITATALKVTDQAGNTIVTAESDGKYTIADDLSSVTMLWLEATTATGNYIAKATKEELRAIAEAGKLKMATLGNIIGSDGKFYANKTAVDAAGKTGVAMIVYLGDEGETNTDYKHGLAIALSDDTGFKKWGPTGTNTTLDDKNTWSKAIADMAGIANTETLDLDADYVAVTPPYTMSVFNPITNGFSIWFLPSAGQWYKFFNGMCNLTWSDFGKSTEGEAGFAIVNQTFVDAGYNTTDAKFENNDYYWSSSEFGNNDAVAVRFVLSEGVYVQDGLKDNDNTYRVRTFLAF